QVFLYGAYKKPREATWMAGVALFLMTLAYGLTGYLLPWDNRAYWGTVVATQIAAHAPLAGPYLSRLLGGGDGVGVVTFARFFGLHVLLLPPATFLLIGLHVYLVRKHGVTPAPDDESLPRRQFYPGQAFKDTVAIFVVFAILFTMAVVVRAPLEQLADPSDTAYTPRPEWYFLFLFQTLKLMPGPLEVFGSVLLPTLAILALILVPFIDRGQMVKVTRRTTAFAFVFLAAAGWTGLTVAAVAGKPGAAPVSQPAEAGPASWAQLSPEELAGIAYLRQENCSACHTIGGGPNIGPDLTRISTHRDAAWMIAHFKRPSSLRPGTPMPPIQLGDAQLNSLAAFLLKLNPKNAAALRAAPEFAVEGAVVYQANQCGACHMIDGVGMRMGPPLNGVAKRHSRIWVEQHFADPAKLSPGSIMPPYRLPPKDLENLTRYLLALE
ncbi:MAG: cytochrome b N-terminal domain-containing protein, partial [Acidobacteriia bacterium]|nr:cytochrome b N-terminal domain-containing protein [Terriglobia bacterium]